MGESGTLLRELLRQRRVRGYPSFCREYSKAAAVLDSSLTHRYPSKAQFYRWLSGELISLPYGEHCRVLEEMFPSWTAEQLFEPYAGALNVVPRPAQAAVPMSSSELVMVHPTRSAVPYDLWTELITSVRANLDVLVYSGQFLVEQHNIVPVIRAKVKDGVRFRFVVGDESADAVVQRAVEEGTTGGLEGRVQMMRRYLREIIPLPGVEVRTHGTVLYNSIYRFDDQMLVNGHAYGSLAGQNPVLQLRRVEGGHMWRHYMESFDRVWAGAREESR
ncbi:hypothetical protein [Actinokineospora globicatena]|uniref:hypothetical protein n=1 Tax=Actinokineospora globicatena TaxID=103729 RepID=UPI0020A35CDE|nr:hypothetical protein [Actinokineospora globicatena]MCP2305005.1 hypothetical protein [Actinokineospora globicatena]GLW80467.1 hypothetical protein Aglo01_49480 [Actinokineospora globicatena]GLW87295.1 hypothetical protein Aglo02_49340 [Actinokineospora globicatena]